jgi:diguanylate cyclase (GGDEF)-like protein
MLMEFVVNSMSADRIPELLLRAGETRRLDELEAGTSWSSYQQFRRLLEERSHLDPTDLYDQAEVLCGFIRGMEAAQSARTLGSPGDLLADGSEFNPLLPIRRYEKTEVGPDEWTIREWFEDGFAPFPQFCDFVRVQYALIPLVFNLPLAEITEEECQCRGDATCLFRLRWEANECETSPEDYYRVRSELFEMRLEQFHDLIADLASSDEYEDVLQELVGSSLRTAVGAGGALLVIAPTSVAPRRIYSEGLADAEVDGIADDLLSGGGGSDGIVAVDVSSARRHHGVLAIDRSGGVFSALSRTTLETFARLAATALDIADAVNEARHQADTAQALLDLAASLNEIVSTKEMAERLVRAVPAIIDCDNAAVFLDNGDQYGAPDDGLWLAGSFGYSDEEAALLASRSFEQLASSCDQLASSSFIPEGVVEFNLSHVGNKATVFAPIVVGERKVGFVAASVRSNPERLASTAGLLDRLKSLAAQASTAISNARLVDQIRFQALHDDLTGLPNRALILDRIEQMLARARRCDEQVGVLFIDLDGFKDVNDALGHGVGDQLLQAVSDRLSVTMREHDSIGRLGGDEFVVLVDGSTMDVGPELVAERLLQVLRAPYALQDLPAGPLTVTASIGIATGTRASAAELLRDADIALYEAKAAGKNGFVAFAPGMHTAVQDHHLLEMDLREALSKRQFRLVYQPIFDLAGGRTTGVEALLRWDHPERGTVQPDAFIPLLEDTGMIIDVGRWVLEEACRQGAAWRERGFELNISVNVSAHQLESDQLVEDVRAVLEHSGFVASLLTIEITETAIMKNVAAVVPRLDALKAAGVRIAIDDFGTGYSSLAYLQQLPVDTLKIDRSFVSSMAGSPEAGALVHTLVQLGKTLGLETLAEGIEEREQYSRLQRENCDSGQGYLYARPLDAECVEAFLVDGGGPHHRREEMAGDASHLLFR